MLALINIGSSAAFNALVSLTIAGFYSCFAVAAAVLLYRRFTIDDSANVWGPFKLGRWGLPVTAASLVYSAIGIFFSFWPASPNPTAESMNWSVVVFFAVILFSMLYWAVWGRKVYTGPVREVIIEGNEIIG